MMKKTVTRKTCIYVLGIGWVDKHEPIVHKELSKPIIIHKQATEKSRPVELSYETL